MHPEQNDNKLSPQYILENMNKQSLLQACKNNLTLENVLMYFKLADEQRKNMVIHLSVHGYLGCFHVLAIINKTAMGMGMQISFQTGGFLSLNKFPEVELLGHKTVQLLTF